MGYFPNLFSPVQIGTMTAKNRLLMSAMSINFGVDDQGRATDQLTEYLAARAAGGVGMMLVGGGAVHPTGLELPRLPTLWDDGCIPSLERMTRAMAPYDVRFGMQLMHGGRQSYHDNKVAPSPLPAPAVVKGVPRELTVPEIRELTASFGDAARRCKEAGFDFIEIHGAHGYLINQFLSPNANRREDAYGGAFDNRIRFLVELIEDIQGKVGRDYPVGIRINGNDYIENGWNLEEALRLSVLLEKMGVAYLHVSAGVYGSTELTIPSMYTAPGCFLHLAEAVKSGVSIPVATVGRIKSPELADRIIAEGKADVVAMGRSFLVDPELPNKAASGRLQEIRPCMGCCLGCIHAVLQLEPGGCVVNPDVGREYQLKALVPAESPKTVLVLGSGPAGLATARMAALRGHRVIVCEASGELGGAARLAGKIPGRGEVFDVVKYFIDALATLAVEIRLNAPLTEPLLGTVSPDLVVTATGSLPEIPIIKGLFQTDMALCAVTDVVAGRAFPGHRVIVLGGGQVGLMAADYLATKGKEVVVLNRKRHFADEMASNDRFYLRERLKKASVTLYKQVSIKKFHSDGVSFQSGGESHRLEGFDGVVVAEKMTAIRKSIELLRRKGIPFHVIGDAKSPRIIMHAIAEGEEIGREI